MQQPQTQNVQPPNTPSFQIPAYVLDDLCSRFIINIPEEERQDLIRIFFQIELAHWFYLDFYCAEQPELKTCGIKDFSAQIFHHCPSLSGHAQEVDKILGNWKSYKMSVPTYGAIMLDPEMKYCLLVQGFWAKASWGFPKGKVNAGEPPCECAIREVFEETGFDVSKMVNPEEFLENKMNDQLTRLYIIENVPLDTKFQPKTRKEIKSLQWFPIDALPAHKRDQSSKTQLGLNPNTFFMVIPFVKYLRKWVANKQNGTETSQSTGAVAMRPPSRPRSATENTGKTSKDIDNMNNSSRQYREKQKLRQQQYFSQMNQNEYQELLQFKDSKTRAREARDRKQQRSEQNNAQGYGSPNYKSDKKQQFHILNRDGTVGGKPRRSLATQFDNQGGNYGNQYQQGKYSNKSDRRQRANDQNTSIENFVPPAWRNFRLDVDAVLACIDTISVVSHAMDGTVDNTPRSPRSARQEIWDNPPKLEPDVLQKLLSEAYHPLSKQLSTLKEVEDEEEEEPTHVPSEVWKLISMETVDESQTIESIRESLDTQNNGKVLESISEKTNRTDFGSNNVSAKNGFRTRNSSASSLASVSDRHRKGD